MSGNALFSRRQKRSQVLPDLSLSAEALIDDLSSSDISAGGLRAIAI